MVRIQAKIRINLPEGEIEIEGSETFVEKHIGKLEKYFNSFKEKKPQLSPHEQEAGIPPIVSADDVAIKQPIITSVNKEKLLTTFGEWIHKLPSDASDVTKVIFAGYYCQKQSENNEFNSSSVNKLLKDHGIKISNTSARIKDLLTAKKIFQVEKVGRFTEFRLSRESEEEIIQTITK